MVFWGGVGCGSSGMDVPALFSFSILLGMGGLECGVGRALRWGMVGGFGVERGGFYCARGMGGWFFLSLWGFFLRGERWEITLAYAEGV